MTLSINNDLLSVDNLPTTYAVALTNFSAISLSGEEQSKYLQGQVTCDVNDLNENALCIGAHCDAKGKVISVFRLINRAGAHLLIQPKESLKPSLAALNKFGVFAKVEIEQTIELAMYALIGDQASELLQQTFGQIPDSLSPTITVGTTTLIYIAGQQSRYLIIDEAERAEHLMVTLTTKGALKTFGQLAWNLTEINEGFPILAEQSVLHYVPQMLNLQAIHGICFTKGCYIGQETVARMQYLGKNKRALFAVSNIVPCHTSVTEDEITAGDIIEQQLGKNWRKAGEVLASYLCDTCSIQAVLASDIDEKTVLRLKKQPDILLSVQDLPYSLKNKD
jgi:tRNA-modifying protein YgfZ